MDECEVAYERGLTASRAGKAMRDNPYPTPAGGCEPAAEWLAWNDGFVAGEQEEPEATHDDDGDTEAGYDHIARGGL